MSKEIEQPNITKPDLDDSFTWASIERVYAEWARHVGPQLDIDVEKFILGDVLVNITGDDEDIFIWTIGGSIFDPEIAAEAKSHLIERLDWEINTPETPQAIREKLEATHEIISSLDWRKKSDFDEARENWFSLKSWVVQQIEENPELKKAEDYAVAMASLLLEPWHEFLYGDGYVGIC